MANTSNHNSGHSWSADRRQSNKNESWEKPMSKRKQRYDNGGGVGKKYKLVFANQSEDSSATYNSVKETENYVFLENPKDKGIGHTFRVNKKTLTVKGIKEGKEGYMFDVPKAVKLIELDKYANGGGVEGNEFYVGQSVIMRDTFPYYDRMTKEMKKRVSPYYNKELVIEEIINNKPHNLAKAFVRSSGQKVPFEINLNKKYIEKYANGGGINSGRDLLFKSQEPHEQAYKRKREFKKYGDNGNWFSDFFENGGDIANQNALMVMNDNKQIKHHTEELNKVVDTNTTVPAWIVAKVHRSASDLSDATHYLDGVNTEFKNGGKVSYGDIKKEKERMTDELLKKCGVFFAFSNEQFLENKTPLKEGEKYVSIGGGGYMPKGNVDAFREGMKSISKIGKKKVEENNLAETEILYELNNHECFYTGDYSDVVDMFKGTYTEQQIRDVYNKNREKFKNGGGISSDIIFVWAKNKEDRDRFFESITNLMPDHFIIKQGDLSVQLEVNPSDMSSIEQMAKTYNVEVIIDNRFEPSAYYGDLISINLAEKALGRKINSWKDDIITIDGISYQKVFLKPEYKQIK